MKKILLFATLVAISFRANAQDFESLLSGGEEHAGKLFSSYLEPAFEGTIYNLNNGWYRTAKTHKKLGFDITVTATASQVPTAKQSFLFQTSNYISDNSRIELASGVSSASLPTAFGGETNEQLKLVQPTGTPLGDLESTFDAPNGLFGDNSDYSDYVPLAMAQVGIGLIKKTDISLRYLPKQSGDDYDVKLFGVGVKHNILQYFPIARRLPLVDVSVFGGYTKLESNYFPTGDDLENININLEVQSYTAQLLASLDLKIINIYGGFGYSAGSSSLSYAGKYTIRNNNTTVGIPNKVVDLNKISPTNVDGLNTLKTTIGASLNLFFIKIFADYSIQEYNSVTAGIALSIR